MEAGTVFSDTTKGTKAQSQIPRCNSFQLHTLYKNNTCPPLVRSCEDGVMMHGKVVDSKPMHRGSQGRSHFHTLQFATVENVRRKGGALFLNDYTGPIETKLCVQMLTRHTSYLQERIPSVLLISLRLRRGSRYKEACHRS